MRTFYSQLPDFINIHAVGRLTSQRSHTLSKRNGSLSYIWLQSGGPHWLSATLGLILLASLRTSLQETNQWPTRCGSKIPMLEASASLIWQGAAVARGRRLVILGNTKHRMC